jgi:hypothetical protein
MLGVHVFSIYMILILNLAGKISKHMWVKIKDSSGILSFHKMSFI